MVLSSLRSWTANRKWGLMDYVSTDNDEHDQGLECPSIFIYKQTMRATMLLFALGLGFVTLNLCTDPVAKDGCIDPVHLAAS